MTSNVFKNNGHFYELHTTNDGVELKKLFKDKKLTEYMTSLRRLLNFTKGSLDENIANDMRKVMETICNFFAYELSQDSLQSIFGQEISANLKLIADDYIHTDFNNFEDPFDSNSLKLAASELIKLIEIKLPKQLKSLE